MSKTRDLADLLSDSSKIKADDLDVGQLGGRRNVLINGDFKVSQRGDFSSPTATNSEDYYLDRWKIYNGAVSSTIEDKGDRVRIEVSDGGTSGVTIRQFIETQNVQHFVNQKVILSAKVTSNKANARLLLFANGGWLPVSDGNDTHSGGGSEETLTAVFDFPSSTGSEVIAVVGLDGQQSSNVSLSTGDYIEIREVQLEVGDTATPFEHRSYGEELALCQRYYETSLKTTQTEPIQFTVDGSAFTTPVSIPIFKVEKRVAPSVSLYDNNATTSSSSVSYSGLTPSGGSSNQEKSLNRIDGFTHCFTIVLDSSNEQGKIFFHYEADAEL